jgi:hypothetical protein
VVTAHQAARALYQSVVTAHQAARALYQSVVTAHQAARALYQSVLHFAHKMHLCGSENKLQSSPKIALIGQPLLWRRCVLREIGTRFFKHYLHTPWGPPIPGVKRLGRGVGHPPHLALGLQKEQSDIQCFFFLNKNVYGYSQFDSRKSPFYSSNRKK